MYEEYPQVIHTDENHCRLCENLMKYHISLKRAKYLSNLQEYGASIHLYDKVIAYVKATDKNQGKGKGLTEFSIQSIARILQQQAEVYDTWEKYDKAIEALQKAKALLEELDSEKDIAHEDQVTRKKDIATINGRIAAIRKKMPANQS